MHAHTPHHPEFFTVVFEGCKRSPIGYLLRARLFHVADLFAIGHISISEVAEANGLMISYI